MKIYRMLVSTFAALLTSGCLSTQVYVYEHFDVYSEEDVRGARSHEVYAPEFHWSMVFLPFILPVDMAFGVVTLPVMPILLWSFAGEVEGMGQAGPFDADFGSVEQGEFVKVRRIERPTSGSRWVGFRVTPAVTEAAYESYLVIYSPGRPQNIPANMRELKSRDGLAFRGEPVVQKGVARIGVNFEPTDPVGHYRLELYSDGRLIETVEFDIVASRPDTGGPGARFDERKPRRDANVESTSENHAS